MKLAGEPQVGSAAEVFLAFLRLGLTSFGGPIAHLGYFRNAFVVRRRWLDEAAYADIVALCQFLPGPTSSQVGIALGLKRAGWAGAAAAWLGFTLPSATLMTGLAFAGGFASGPDGAILVHGLKLVAVVIVAQAALGMARSLAPDPARRAIAIAGATVALLVPGAPGQFGALTLGGLAGLIWLQAAGPAERPADAPAGSRRLGAACLVAFMALLVGLTLLDQGSEAAGVGVAAVFYRAGALVFGGGHVVLPLLQSALVPRGWIDNDRFLAGYGVAQAMPGPLFTIAAFIGASLTGPPNGVGGAALALIFIFLPGCLALFGVLPFWTELARSPQAQKILRGVNAAVVGLLAAALVTPIGTSALSSIGDAAIAVAAFLILVILRAPPIAIVLGVIGASFAEAHLATEFA